ncbi:hypothetical protein Kpol_1009p11 [Vanderwaltozyma polyspora DSM 70294]|uniref:Matrin-type domain-containing protein n=1 Tax=Vanderwaltozyma polyspora (strain ATCC 22028 / DSM 70294 / BCRC 21397 / CBS 2163 / NBRC 10782 / NRRL Y-8283 / UCD 57-17) TaxID=436907 RepID=A7TPD7_VANPO|nr:uncharacterized protein Kpol_1009p11 [Vanderwaltozyma polyspora DSM 70294]EDO15865.1 hypothetical protein Kpol_1009p11 [Vanderwaltozyma polyspora DSM 70294]
MVRYYCEYCHSYLTHDTKSVRRSHLVGKNHLKAVADYYRNKNDKSKKVGNNGVLWTRRNENKRLLKLAKVHERENNEELGVLSQMYRESPGYHKVFAPSQRLDVRDYIRSSKLPQRANLSNNSNNKNSMSSSSTRNVLTRPTTTTAPLPPPLLLTQWSSQPPKQIYPRTSR